MVRLSTVLLLLIVNAPAWSADACTGKVTAQVLVAQRDQRQGAGLLINHCAQPVRAEVMVMAINRDGFPVARLRTQVEADASPISVFQVDLPFVQSAITLSGYNTIVAVIETVPTSSPKATPVLSQTRRLPVL